MQDSFSHVCALSDDSLYVIYLHYTDDIQEAYSLIKDLEPTTPQEYILKGVVNAALGQDQGTVSSRVNICSLDAF